ncbi:expressed unknown protein [Seminavis robusta]|uniref:Uncharacterized protein n=1 Tax=Seminavis robusta TaxID=568900 RepID=A0A9N8F252_9STRA|nr:expressed unknown protein [Seminavis robusta]|eukprot:Sro2657_g333850.1 n/a (267) ;mRNA; f:7894-8694
MSDDGGSEEARGLAAAESPDLVEEEEEAREESQEDDTHSLLFYKDWLESQIGDLSPASATDYYHAELVRLEVNEVGDARYVKHIQCKIEHTSAAARAIQAAFGTDDVDDEELQFGGGNHAAVVDLVPPTPFSLGRPADGADGGDTSSLVYYKDWVDQNVSDSDDIKEVMVFLKSEGERLSQNADVDVDGRYKIHIEGLIADIMDAQALKEVKEGKIKQKETTTAAPAARQADLYKDTTPEKTSLRNICCAVLWLCCPLPKKNIKSI